MFSESVGDRNRAAAAILASMFGYGVMDASSKILLHSIPAFEILFFRNLIILVGVILISRATSTPRLVQTHQPLLQIVRSFAGNVAVLLFIISYGFMQLAQVVSVSFLAPIFAAVWDYLIFRQKTTWSDWVLVLIGCAGVWLILRPGFDVTGLQALLPLCASVLLGFYLSAAKWLRPSESNLTVVLYFSLVGAIMSLPMVLLSWTNPSTYELGLLFLGGCCGGIGIGLRNFSYRHAPAIFLGPFEYTGIIWAWLFGFLLFSARPSAELIIGTIAIVMLNLFRLFVYRGSPKEIG